MPDFLSPLERSKRMALIKSAGNKSTELRLIKFFREYGITGWRRKSRILGNPDFVFSKWRVVVFVDGCFWHGCPKHSAHITKSGSFWVEKIQKNQQRDKYVKKQLKIRNWQVLRIWEHELKAPERLLNRFKAYLPS